LRAPESMDDPEHVADVPTFRVSKN
jgi:hypothetical protein